MCSTMMMILAAFVVQTLASLTANHADSDSTLKLPERIGNSTDQLANELRNRVMKMSPLLYTELDDTALQKRAHFLAPALRPMSALTSPPRITPLLGRASAQSY